MSGMFGQDRDGDDAADPSDRPLSPHPNFVTPEGMAQIDLNLARAQQGWDEATAAGDQEALARFGRELRYWVARRGTAQTVPPAPGAGVVRFGAAVTVRGADGAARTWRIVGEDEAELSPGTLSYVSPLAQALTGRRPGETVTADGETVEILATP